MRNAFANEITEIAKSNPDVVLLSGDIGNRMFDKFKIVAKERFFNCGIAEANMMSTAAGLASTGLRPFVYTITPFTTTRCLEQIKIGLGYHNYPVVIVGTGSGLSYAELGPTHHSLEDIAIIRSIPGISIYSPSDPNEVKAHIHEALKVNKPSYIRLGKKGEKDLSPRRIRKHGLSSILNEGQSLLVISYGPIVSSILDSIDELEEYREHIEFLDIGRLNPLPNDLLEECSIKFSKWLVIEEHYEKGGLGSMLLEWQATTKKNAKNLTVFLKGAPHEFIHKLGDQNYVRSSMKLDKQGIIEKIKSILENDNRI